MIWPRQEWDALIKRIWLVGVQSTYSRVFFLIFFCCIGNLSAQESNANNLDYSKDISMQILLNLFGPLVTTSTNTVVPDTVLSTLMTYLLPAATMIAVTLASIMIYLGTVFSASEGKALGSKWSTSIIPLRLTVGLALLIPDGNGFAIIQKVFITIIIMGINLANSLWNQVISNFEVGNLLNNRSGIIANEQEDISTNLLVKRFFVTAIDLRYQQQDKQYDDVFFSVPNNSTFDLTIESSPSGLSLDRSLIFRIKDITNDTSQISQQDLFNEYKVTLANFGNMMLSDPFVLDAVEQLKKGEDILADRTGQKYDSDIMAAWLLDKTEMLKRLLVSAADDSSADSQIQSLQQQGWFYAGNYYWLLQSTRSPMFGLNMPQFSMDAIADSKFKGTQSKTRQSKVERLWGSIQDSVNKSTIAGDNSIPKYGAVSLDFSFKEAFVRTYDPLTQFVLYCQNKIFSLISSILIAITASMAFFLIVLLGVARGGILPFTNAALYIVMIVIVIFLSIGGIVIAPLCLGAVYIPLIPMIVFLSGAISWVIKVIEALLAAPIIAVALIEPGEDEFGRTAQAGVMLLNVALRPALMIVGFVFSARIVVIGMYMAADIVSSIGDFLPLQDSFTRVMLDLAKVGIVVTLVQVIVTRCFSLIYLLPDKIFSWIGDRGDSTDSRSFAQEIEGGIKDSVKLLESIFKVGSQVQKVVQDSLKKRQ